MCCLSAVLHSTPGEPVQLSFVHKLQRGRVFCAPPRSTHRIHHMREEVSTSHSWGRVCVCLQRSHTGTELITSARGGSVAPDLQRRGRSSVGSGGKSRRGTSSVRTEACLNHRKQITPRLHLQLLQNKNILCFSLPADSCDFHHLRSPDSSSSSRRSMEVCAGVI